MCFKKFVNPIGELLCGNMVVGVKAVANCHSHVMLVVLLVVMSFAAFET